MTIRHTALALLASLALTASVFASDFGYGPAPSAYGRQNFGYKPATPVCDKPVAPPVKPACEPTCKTTFVTKYREECITKYREECVTEYVAKEFQVPRQVTEVCFKEIPQEICETITDYRCEEVDKGCFVTKTILDDCGRPVCKKVWVPNLVTIKVPFERQVTRIVMKKVPYETTKTVMETIVKQVPVQRTIKVPYQVTIKVPYQVAVKSCEAPQHSIPQHSNQFAPKGYAPQQHAPQHSNHSIAALPID